jgi:signal transduction histidine kinase
VRSFRFQIVASTVLLVAAVMVAVVLGTQLVLELGEHDPGARSPWNIMVATGLVGACGVVLSGWAAWCVSHRALKPVRDMAERAEEWSAQNLARRFGLGPPVSELSQLGQTLDHLLDRVAHAIRAEQRFSAELAHEIRTPLAAIRRSAEPATACSTTLAGKPTAGSAQRRNRSVFYNALGYAVSRNAGTHVIHSGGQYDSHLVLPVVRS